MTRNDEERAAVDHKGSEDRSRQVNDRETDSSVRRPLVCYLMRPASRSRYLSVSVMNRVHTNRMPMSSSRRDKRREREGSRESIKARTKKSIGAFVVFTRGRIVSQLILCDSATIPETFIPTGTSWGIHLDSRGRP